MASDCTDLASITVQFTPGTPFAPYEQLLAVQPSSSCRLLPEPYRWLMTDPKSPIADFYPVDFATDMEGKRAEWEAVVLIPFIDEQRLLAAARSVSAALLTESERARNAPGDIMVFTHKEDSTEDSFCTSTLPAHYTSVTRSNSTALSQAAPPPLPAGEKGFVPSFVSGTKVGATGPAGFPTLRTLALSGVLHRAGVNVFGMTSKRESLILTMRDQLGGATLAAQQVAAAVVGHRAWVKWPYLQEAVVEAVSDGKVRAGRDASLRQLTPAEADEWHRDAARLTNDHLTKQGLDLGQVTLLLHVRPCEGLVRRLDGTVEKRFGKAEATFPLQATLRRNPAPDPRFQTQAEADGGAATAPEPLEAGTKALFLGRAHYGCMAEVVASGQQGLSRSGKALVASSPAAEGADGPAPAKPVAGPYRVLLTPAPANAAQVASAAKRILGNVSVQYQPSGQVARRLGVSPRTLGRITGNVWVQCGEERRDRVDVGLCVKNGGKGLCVPDFCAPMQPSARSTNQYNGGQGGEAPKAGWAYSDAMVRVLEQYKQRYNWVWVALEQDTSGAMDMPLAQMLPGIDREAAQQQVAQLRKWLKSLPLARRPLVKTSAKVSPESAVRMLQAALPPKPWETETLEMENVAPALLLPPLDRGGLTSAFAGGTFELADRVVSAGSAGAPPFGARGTVVGVYDDAIEVLFDQEFLGGDDLFGRCNGNCGALLLNEQLLNLTRPHAVKAEGSGAPKVVGRRADASTAAASESAGTNGAAVPGAPMSAAAALAAATAGLQDKKDKKQPAMPDKSGSKGFTMGRGRGIPPPPPPVAAAQQPPPAPGANAGMQLLASLKGQSPGAVPPLPPIPMAPPPPPHFMPMMAGPPPPGPPGGMVMMMSPNGQPVPMWAPPGMVPMHPGPHMPMPPHPGMVAGQSLLAQLQGKTPSPVAPAGVAPPPPPPPQQPPQQQPSPNAGSALLSQLQASSQQKSPGQNGAAAAPVAAKAEGESKPQDAAPGAGLDSVWERLQAEHSGGASSAVEPAAAAPQAPPPPPSAALLGGSDGSAAGGEGSSAGGKSPDANAFWQLLSNASKPGGT